ncbi:MAG TPA: sigma-54 dependent transcriptional regulator [Phycisphaerae bacterium]|nr:sigma-54 dependent transcriptional regulator [Phycisphaerae bacterium]
MSDGGKKAEVVPGQSARSALTDPTSSECSQPVLVGRSPLFRQVLAVVDAVAANDSVVLLEGESGTGKELLARRIHRHSPRRGMPFIPVNCPGVSDTLFESQFYGHMRGSFTGATSDTLGIARAAEGGTLLLDEVGDLPIHLQPKLLRLIQEREVTPVGASRPIPVNVRFIASTNRNLARRAADGTFRSDLYHRLNVVRVVIAPLRARPEDVDELLDYYVEFYARQYAMRPRLLGPRLRQRLREYPWPGNVRELCGYVERLYAANLPPMPPVSELWDDGYSRIPAPADPGADRGVRQPQQPVGCSLAEAEARAIRQALGLTGYNRSAAARLLDIHRSTLLRKIRLLGLD